MTSPSPAVSGELREIEGEKYRVALTVYMEVTASSRGEAHLIAERALGFPSQATARAWGPVRVEGSVNGYRCVGHVWSAEAHMSRALDPDEESFADWEPS